VHLVGSMCNWTKMHGIHGIKTLDSFIQPKLLWASIFIHKQYSLPSLTLHLRVMKAPKTLKNLTLFIAQGLLGCCFHRCNIIKNASILFYFIVRACSGVFVCSRVWRRREVPKITHAFTLHHDICSISQSGPWRQLNGMCDGRVDVPVWRVIALQFYYCGVVRKTDLLYFVCQQQIIWTGRRLAGSFVRSA
jgi:hypothetical protein